MIQEYNKIHAKCVCHSVGRGRSFLQGNPRTYWFRSCSEHFPRRAACRKIHISSWCFSFVLVFRCAFGTVFDGLLNKKHRPIQSGDQKRGNGCNNSKHYIDRFLNGRVILDFLDGFHGVFSFVLCLIFVLILILFTEEHGCVGFIIDYVDLRRNRYVRR